MIKEIRIGKKIFGRIIDLADIPEGTRPASEDGWPLQLLMMKRKRGHVVPDHMHKRITKTTTQPQEGLVIIKGEACVKISDRKRKRIGTYTVKAGQCLFLADGAHEVIFTKDTLAFEFKTGPYVPDKIPLKA